MFMGTHVAYWYGNTNIMMFTNLHAPDITWQITQVMLNIKAKGPSQFYARSQHLITTNPYISRSKVQQMTK
jgi:hypothetical protein